MHNIIDHLNLDKIFIITSYKVLDLAIISLVTTFIFRISNYFTNKYIISNNKLQKIISKSLLSVISKTINLTILLLGFLIGLSIVGVNINNIITSIGLTSLGLSLAMKEVLSNLISGILIMVYQPFKIGQVISVGQYSGKVIAIDMRCTTLLYRGTTIIIPNSIIINKEIIIN